MNSWLHSFEDSGGEVATVAKQKESNERVCELCEKMAVVALRKGTGYVHYCEAHTP